MRQGFVFQTHVMGDLALSLVDFGLFGLDFAFVQKLRYNGMVLCKLDEPFIAKAVDSVKQPIQ